MLQDERITLRGLSIFNILIILMITTLLVLPPVYSNGRPVINSRWITNPPTIDGVFSLGEWSTPQLILLEPTYPINASVYFVNDNTNLYVMVDAVGDGSDSVGDESLLWFNYDPQTSTNIVGQGGVTKTNGYTAAIGYGSSPNNGTDHKIYEFCIPFTYINAVIGQPIDICSPYGKVFNSIAYDSETDRDNIWPPGLDEEILSTWGILNLQAQQHTRPRTHPTVGGIVSSANRLHILLPYITLICLSVAVISIGVQKKQNTS